jgi:predicted membrane channel-forming protein YqfA (hemolysin III family)
LFLLLIVSIPTRSVKSWFCTPVPFRSTSIIFALCAGVFTLLWLKEIIPALQSHTIPDSIAVSGLPINPVHILDLAILLPGMLLTAFLLQRRHPLGWILAPMLLIFSVLMSINIAVLTSGKPGVVVYGSLVLALFFIYAAWHFLRHLKRSNELRF